MNTYTKWLLGNSTLGFEKSSVVLPEGPYLTRWILHIAGRTLRLHKFYRGDDDRAFHDHPWHFWTFPLEGYWEKVPGKFNPNYVRPFRWNYRPAKYRHIVLRSSSGRPFYTIVVTGKHERTWGFWPEPYKFVPWQEWT